MTEKIQLNPQGKVKLFAQITGPTRYSYNDTAYAHAIVRPVCLTSDYYEGSSGFGEHASISYSFRYGVTDLDDIRLEIRCQADDSEPSHPPYGFETRIEDIDSARKARIALRVHESIDRSLGKLRDEYGYSFGSTFGQYLIGVCKALKVTEVGIESPTWPDGIRWCTPAEAADALDSTLSQVFVEDAS